MGNGDKKVRALDRQTEALKLRQSGMAYDDIASQLGWRSRAGAYAAVMRALKTTLQEPSDDVRKLELERLDRLLSGLWDMAANGNLDAADRALKIMERRAKLLGLDAPTKIAPTDPTGAKVYEGLSDDERTKRIVALLKQTGMSLDKLES